MSWHAWDAASANGKGDWMFFTLTALALCLAIIVGFIAGCICLGFSAQNPHLRFLALLGFCGASSLLIGMFIGGSIGQRIRMNALDGLAEHSVPLVTAIKDYEQKFGHPPDSLDALVPDFLPKILSTGIGATPEYQYRSFTNGFYYGTNKWVLEVFHGAAPLGFDTFIYLPSQDYSALPRERENQIKKIRDWAYWYKG